MSKRNLVIVALVAVLAIGARGALAAPLSTTGLSLSSTSGSSRSDWEISGTIQSMNGQFWNVQGFSIRVNDSTAVTGGIPTVGSTVSVSGVVQGDGSWLARSVKVGADLTPTMATTPVATGTPTAMSTVTSTAIVSSSMTPTATTTLTSGGSATVTATTTPPVRRTPDATGSPSPHRDRNDRRDREDRLEKPGRGREDDHRRGQLPQVSNQPANISGSKQDDRQNGG